MEIKPISPPQNPTAEHPEHPEHPTPEPAQIDGPNPTAGKVHPNPWADLETTAASGPTSSTEHFEEAAQAEAEADGSAGPATVAAPDGGRVLSLPAFQDGFAGIFNMAGALTGLQSLAVADGERPQADECARAVYDIAYETPALRFIISPGGKWMERATAIGFFVVPKVMLVRLEIAQRRKPAPAAPADPEAANDSTPAGADDPSTMAAYNVAG